MKPSRSLGLAAASARLLGTAAAATVPSLLPSNFSCPQVHVFAARETTAAPGFGSAKTVVDLVMQNFQGATAEAINYPAAGANNSDYARSVRTGVISVLTQLQFFWSVCPDTILIMHGYSQGAQIMEDAFCGGPDGVSLNSTGSMVPSNIADKVAAIIMMGNPRHVDGLVYNVGNATAPGFAARPKNFTCPEFQDRMQSYCDSPDPFCAKGDSPAFHQGYGMRNGQQALQFIMSKVLVSGQVASTS